MFQAPQGQMFQALQDQVLRQVCKVPGEEKTHDNTASEGTAPDNVSSEHRDQQPPEPASCGLTL